MKKYTPTKLQIRKNNLFILIFFIALFTFSGFTKMCMAVPCAELFGGNEYACMNCGDNCEGCAPSESCMVPEMCCKLNYTPPPLPPAGDTDTGYGNDTKFNMSLFGQKTGLTTATDPVLEEKIINYINVLLSFIGLILLVLIIIAGIQWMTSGGNEEIIKKAKSTIKNAIIGLFIIIASWIIANTVMQIILNSTNEI